MIALSKGCPNLTELDVRVYQSGFKVTVIGLKALANAPFCSSLETLCFRCNGVDDDAVEYLSHFPHLQKLSILPYTRFEPIFSGEQLRKCLSRSLKWIELENVGDSADLVIIGEVSL